jgi:four helix bundle protein
MHNFRQLEIWRIGMELTKKIYHFSNKLPNSQRFAVISQMQRSSASIPSNIAEGCGRDSKKTFSYFLQIALGSAFELETQLLLCQDLFSIEEKEVAELIDLVQKCQKMLIGLKRSLNT